VKDIKAISSYGVMMTPALVVDGVVKVAGRIPKLEEIKNWLK
jgi:protein-disulfide isomerase